MLGLISLHTTFETWKKIGQHGKSREGDRLTFRLKMVDGGNARPLSKGARWQRVWKCLCIGKKLATAAKNGCLSILLVPTSIFCVIVFVLVKQ